MIYWYPNRPILIPPSEISRYEGGNWTAEIKMDGSRLVLQRLEDGKWRFMNRHKEVMSYHPIPEVMEELEALGVPPGSQLDGEMMHAKTKNVKNRLVMYDIYLWGGKKQRGTLDERREMLSGIIDGKGFEKIVRSKVHFSGFEDLFREVIGCREHEGIVLKDRTGRIKFNPAKSPDVPWQIKARRPHKNYEF
jgi:ATP-dependent DNA ligase